MLDRGDAKFPEHHPGILCRATLIPLFVFSVGEAGPLTSSPALGFGGSTEIEKCANVLPHWKNAILPRQRRSIRVPKAKGDSCNKGNNLLSKRFLYAEKLRSFSLATVRWFTAGRRVMATNRKARVAEVYQLFISNSIKPTPPGEVIERAQQKVSIVTYKSNNYT